MNVKARNHAVIYVVAAALIVLVAIISACQHYGEKLRAQIYFPAAPRGAIVLQPLTNFPNVLLLGDSRMAQWGLPDLGKRCVINAAVGGITSGQLRPRAAEALKDFHPAVVVLEAGINDLKYLGVKPRLKEEIVSITESNLMAVVSACSAPGRKVILLKVWPASQPSLARRLVWSSAVKAGTDQLNLRLEKLNSPERNIFVVDVFGQAGISFSEELYTDTLHFTPETYARLAPVLEKLLDEIQSPDTHSTN